MFTECCAAVYGFGVVCAASRYCLSSAALLLIDESSGFAPCVAGAKYCVGGSLRSCGGM